MRYRTRPKTGDKVEQSDRMNEIRAYMESI